MRKYLRDSKNPEYAHNGTRISKLDTYKAYIDARIKSALPHWIPATVIYREIIEQGYSGKIRILRYYMQSQKPLKRADPVVRFETAAAQQMQYV